MDQQEGGMSEIQSMNHDGCTAPWLTKYSYWEVNLGKIAAHLFCATYCKMASLLWQRNPASPLK